MNNAQNISYWNNNNNNEIIALLDIFRRIYNYVVITWIENFTFLLSQIKVVKLFTYVFNSNSWKHDINTDFSTMKIWMPIEKMAL